MSKVTIFPTIKATTKGQHVDLLNILEWIKEGQWREQVEKVRDIYEEVGRDRQNNKYKKAKSFVPYFTGSGTFDKRETDGLVNHSGFIIVDIDEFGGNWDEAKTMIANDPYTYSVFYSISGDGLAVAIKIHPEDHKDVFEEVKRYYLDTYSIKIDFLADVARARFISYDDELVLNEGSIEFQLKYESTVEKKYESFQSSENGQFLKGDEKYHFDLAIKWVKKTGWDYVDGQRHSFMIRCALLWNEFGIGEQKVRELVSETYPHFLEGRNETNAITWTYKTKKEKFGIKYRKSTHGGSQVEDNGNEDAKNNQQSGNKKGRALDLATEFILDKWGEHLFINELNNRIEYKRSPIDDRFVNIVWKECNRNLPVTISQTDINSLLNSDILPEYNPILDFFQTHELSTSGNIDKIALSLNTKTYSDEFVKVLFKKWIVGAVANIFERIMKSPLQLVIYGGQNTGKSWFFRQLLPNDLLVYYAEDKLDNPKDAAQLMCAKILIMDDEYGGKSKHDSKVLKDLISKHEFTVRLPYARMPTTMRRIATLCGTTNEPDILVDTTGNRRIIPVEIHDRNYDIYDSIDKSQLWLEAYHLYKNGFKYELTKPELAELNANTEKFERLSIESGLVHKYIRPVPEDECCNVSFKQAAQCDFEWMTTTEVLLYVKEESRLTRINQIQLGKEMKKDNFFQKSHKVKGKVRRYWACKKISNGSDMSEYTHPMGDF